MPSTADHRSRALAVTALTLICLALAACSSSGSAAGSASVTSANSTNATSTTSTSTSASASASAASSRATSAVAATSAAHAGAGAAACTLITEQDVTAGLGADPGKGSASDQAQASQCTYGSFPKEVLLVNVLRIHGRAAFTRAHTDPKLRAAPGSSLVPISGLGDQAFELATPHTDAIYFTRADTLIVVAFAAPSAPTKGAALALARIAAGRL